MKLQYWGRPWKSILPTLPAKVYSGKLHSGSISVYAYYSSRHWATMKHGNSFSFPFVSLRARFSPSSRYFLSPLATVCIYHTVVDCSYSDKGVFLLAPGIYKWVAAHDDGGGVILLTFRFQKFGDSLIPMSIYIRWFFFFFWDALLNSIIHDSSSSFSFVVIFVLFFFFFTSFSVYNVIKKISKQNPLDTKIFRMQFKTRSNYRIKSGIRERSARVCLQVCAKKGI